MKTKAMSSFFVLFAIAAGIVAMTPGAFAEDKTVTIEAAQGSGSPGCEETPKGCFLPMTATIDVGGKVIFLNTDSAAHTFTSGEATDADSVGVVFDSSLVMAGNSYEWIPEEEGDQPYFCIVHPWMAGMIIVQGAEHGGMTEELMVTIKDSVKNGETKIDLGFNVLHVNYEITATQGGKEIFKETAHAMEMTKSHMVKALGSDKNPIDIKIVSLGIGPPGAEADWTGPTGSVATAKVVPEFGTIAMMILAVAIISIVAVTAKSRVVPKF